MLQEDGTVSISTFDKKSAAQMLLLQCWSRIAISQMHHTQSCTVSHSITSKIRSNAVKLRVTHARTLLSGPQPHPARRPEALKPTPLPRAALLLTRNPPLQPPGPDRPKTPTSHLLLSRHVDPGAGLTHGQRPKCPLDALRLRTPRIIESSHKPLRRSTYRHHGQGAGI